MKKGYATIFLAFSLQAQQHERALENLVNALDQETMKVIEKPTDVQKKELVAAFNRTYEKWFYAEVIDAPGQNFDGSVAFVRCGPYAKDSTINFMRDVRKLLTKEELQQQQNLEYEQQKKSEHSCCSLQ